METDAAQAVERLIEDYGKLVFHVIYGLTGNWQESEDLSQDTFLHAFCGIDAARWKAGAQFQAKAWLLRIAVNTVRMQHRRQHSLRFFTFSELERTAGATEQTEDVPSAGYVEMRDVNDLETVVAERDIVQQCLHHLPEPLRLPLLLSVVSGFSTSEIAQMLALNEATVRQRLSRARKHFQRLYREASGETVSIGERIVSPPAKRLARPRGHVLHRPTALAPVVVLAQV